MEPELHAVPNDMITENRIYSKSSKILMQDKFCQTEFECNDDSPRDFYHEFEENNFDTKMEEIQSKDIKYQDSPTNRTSFISKKDNPNFLNESIIRDLMNVNHEIQGLKEEIYDINSIVVDMDSSSSSDSSIIDHIQNWKLKKYHYENLKDRMIPLDIILFSGSDFVSKMIQFLQKKKLGKGIISHVGIVINKELMPHIEGMEKDKLYIWESTSSVELPLVADTVPDISGKGKFGIQIRDLQEVIIGYNHQEKASVYWGKLRNNPWRKKDNEHIDEYKKRRKKIKWLIKECHEIYGKSHYDASVLDLLSSLYPTLRPLRNMKLWILKKITNKRKRDVCKSKFFCSEFIAILYKTLEIIPNYINPSNVVPVDFLGYDKDGMPFLLSKLCQITA